MYTHIYTSATLLWIYKIDKQNYHRPNIITYTQEVELKFWVNCPSYGCALQGKPKSEVTYNHLYYFIVCNTATGCKVTKCMKRSIVLLKCLTRMSQIFGA